MRSAVLFVLTICLTGCGDAARHETAAALAPTATPATTVASTPVPLRSQRWRWLHGAGLDDDVVYGYTGDTGTTFEELWPSRRDGYDADSCKMETPIAGDGSAAGPVVVSQCTTPASAIERDPAELDQGLPLVQMRDRKERFAVAVFRTATDYETARRAIANSDEFAAVADDPGLYHVPTRPNCVVELHDQAAAVLLWCGPGNDTLFGVLASVLSEAPPPPTTAIVVR